MALNETHQQIGSIVREYRQKKRMTQLDLAKKLGYDSTQFVSLFERGVSKIPYQTIGQLISILGIPEKKLVKILVSAYEQDIQKKILAGKTLIAQPPIT